MIFHYVTSSRKIAHVTKNRAVAGKNFNARRQITCLSYLVEGHGCLKVFYGFLRNGNIHTVCH